MNAKPIANIVFPLLLATAIPNTPSISIAAELNHQAQSTTSSIVLATSGLLMDEDPIGILRPSEQSILRVVSSGNVEHIHAKEGDLVKSNSALLALDDRMAQARLVVAVSQAKQGGTVKSAKLRMEMLAKELQFLNQAVTNKSASTFESERKQSEYFQAEAEWESAIARQEQLDAAVDLAKAELDQLIVTAPYDCEVIQIHVDRGSSTGPSEDAVTVAQLEVLSTELFIPIAYRESLIQGETYQLIAEQPRYTVITATLDHISSVVHPTTRSIRCKFKVDNTDRQISAGLHVRLPVKQLADR